MYGEASQRLSNSPKRRGADFVTKLFSKNEKTRAACEIGVKIAGLQDCNGDVGETGRRGREETGPFLSYPASKRREQTLGVAVADAANAMISHRVDIFCLSKQPIRGDNTPNCFILGSGQAAHVRSFGQAVRKSNVGSSPKTR